VLLESDRVTREWLFGQLRIQGRLMVGLARGERRTIKGVESKYNSVAVSVRPVLCRNILLGSRD
jgi:hypothetical protein